jgi:hypothetical protein
MFLINVHKFDVIFAQSVCLAALEYQVHDVWGIFGLQREDVLILRRFQDFRKGGQIDAEGKVAIATEGREAFGFEYHGDEGNVGVVHRLKCNARIIAIEITVLNQIFDGVDDLGT